MLVETFAKRLQKALDMNEISQSKLVEKTGLDKSLISNYLAGNYQARQDKIFILAKALNVNEAWLMGYDVPSDYNFGKTEHESPLSQNQIDKIYFDLKNAIDIELKKQDENGYEIMINEKDSLSASDFKKILELAELEPDKLKKALEVIDLITK